MSSERAGGTQRVDAGACLFGRHNDNANACFSPTCLTRRALLLPKPLWRLLPWELRLVALRLSVIAKKTPPPTLAITQAIVERTMFLEVKPGLAPFLLSIPNVCDL